MEKAGLVSTDEKNQIDNGLEKVKKSLWDILFCVCVYNQCFSKLKVKKFLIQYNLIMYLITVYIWPSDCHIVFLFARGCALCKSIFPTVILVQYVCAFFKISFQNGRLPLFFFPFWLHTKRKRKPLSCHCLVLFNEFYYPGFFA